MLSPLLARLRGGHINRRPMCFRKHGTPEVPSSFPFGSAESTKVVTGKLNFMEIGNSIYDQYKQLPVVGFINFGAPTLVINDLDLAKQILVKDFDHFVDRRTFDLNNDVLVNKYVSNMLIAMTGDKWKYTRNTLSPIFTSGKLKAMTAMLNKVGKRQYIALTIHGRG